MVYPENGLYFGFPDFQSLTYLILFAEILCLLSYKLQEVYQSKHNFISPFQKVSQHFTLTG